MNLYGLTSLSLICHRCTCGELNVHGFPHQLKWTIKDRTARTVLLCECGKSIVKSYRLTTGRGRHRMFKWDKIFWRCCGIIPKRILPLAVTMTLWLEGNVKL